MSALAIVAATGLLGFGLASAQLPLTGATAIAAGFYDGCAAMIGGGVKCWGGNYWGEVGDGTTTQRLTAVDVVGLGGSATTAVIAGQGSHACALMTGGGIRCWGNNGFGQLGNGTTDPGYSPVDVTGMSAGVPRVSVNYQQSCAITAGGGAKCWGYNNKGQLGDGTQDQRWTPVDVVGLSSGVTAIATGGTHTCAVIGGGVKCWGDNSSGQLGDGTHTDRLTPVDVYGLTSGVIDVAAGSHHSCALTSGGGIKCWGSNGHAELGIGLITADQTTPVQVFGLTSGVTAVRGGSQHTCALITGGAVKCWGWNSYGQLGTGSTSWESTPADVVGLASGVTAISVGASSSCAVAAGGAAMCWGQNSEGQLGNNGVTNSTVPVPVLYFPPPSAPDAPTGVTATAGNTSATITFTPPANDGGSLIIGYKVTSNPAGGVDAHAGSTMTTHTVVGLTNGTSYTFTVTATNAIGTGSPSAPSNSVTPSVPAMGQQPSGVLVVAAQGGSFTSIQAAIARAASFASATNPMLVLVAPGVYLEQVTLADHVDVEGAGPEATQIVSTAAGGTVITGAKSELRNLAVVNTRNATDPGANAIYQTGNTAAGSTRLRNVTLVADGPTDNLAVRVTGGKLTILDAEVEVAPSGTPTGLEAALYASGASAVIEFRDGKLAAKGSGTPYAAYRAAGATLKIDNAQLIGTTFGAPQCFQTYGPTFTPAACP